MKKIFLDLGTHYGEGLNEFIQKYNMDNSWTIHTFEANPATYDVFTKQFHQRTPWVIPHLEAISTYDGTIDLNMETPPGEGPTGMGSSVIPLEKWDPWGGKNHEPFKNTVKVACIDFSKFIQDNFTKDDMIVIKMDIEGSEYDVLDRMILDHTIEYIDDLYVEWHNRCFSNSDEMLKKENQIIKTIQSLNVKLENWR